MTDRSRSRRREATATRRGARDRASIDTLINANEVPSAHNNSQVLRLGPTLTLTDARGNLNQRGQLFERILTERNDLPHDRARYSTDPFIRGTVTEGRHLVAHRLSGKPVRVAQVLNNGTIKVSKAGDSYYRENRSEYVVHLPI